MNSYRYIHKDFKLDNRSVTGYNELINKVAEQYPEHLSFLQKWFDKQTEIEVQTSGSTGMPKTIKVKKQYLVNSALKTIDYFKLFPKTKALLNLSSDFIAGKLMWIRAFTGGWHLSVSSPRNEAIAGILSKQKFDFGAMVPVQAYHNLSLLNQFQILIIGGGAVSTELQNKLQNLSARIFATYGMTETLTHIAVKPLNTKADDTFNNKLYKQAYTVLKDIHIETDMRGCLVVKAPGITDKKLITNDLVKILDPKHFLWQGRYDNIVNSGGIKLIPEQIEQKLQTFIKNEFFVAGIPDAKLGEKLILIIESSTRNIDIPDFDKLLNNYERPKEIYFVKEFIRTASGKIKRKATINKIINSL